MSFYQRDCEVFCFGKGHLRLTIDGLSFVNAINDITPLLSYIIPVFFDRLSQEDVVEPSEEIRLIMVKIFLKLVQSSQEGFAPFVDDTVKILARTLADPYQEVRKVSCKIVAQLALTNPRPLAFHGAAVAKAIVPCLHHRHSSVRILGIQVLPT